MLLVDPIDPRRSDHFLELSFLVSHIEPEESFDGFHIVLEKNLSEEIFMDGYFSLLILLRIFGQVHKLELVFLELSLKKVEVFGGQLVFEVGTGVYEKKHIGEQIALVGFEDDDEGNDEVARGEVSFFLEVE